MSTRRWQWGAFALALLASLAWALVPTVSASSVSASEATGHPGSVIEVGTSSGYLNLVQADGPSVLFALLLPVAATLLPLLIPEAYARLIALGCTVLLVLFLLAALFSVGIGYLPALVLAVVAVARGNPGRSTRADAHHAVADTAG